VVVVVVVSSWGVVAEGFLESDDMVLRSVQGKSRQNDGKFPTLGDKLDIAGWFLPDDYAVTGWAGTRALSHYCFFNVGLSAARSCQTERLLKATLGKRLSPIQRSKVCIQHKA